MSYKKFSTCNISSVDNVLLYKRIVAHAQSDLSLALQQPPDPALFIATPLGL